MAQAQRIGISLGNIGSWHDGLGEFALQLGRRIAAQALQWRDDYGVAFDFHLRAQHVGMFGGDVGYLTINRWQRWHHVRAAPHAIWHSLHQLNKTLPPRGAGVRLLTVHDLNYVYHPSASSRWRHRRRTEALIARTDHVVAISRWTAADVQRHLGWCGPLDVIYNGARDVSSGPQEPLPGVGARPFLFHLSRMSPSKNPQALLALAAAWPEMDFLLCGPEGGDSRALRDRTRLPNVRFRLGISDAQKAWAFAHCAGFVFPSLAEGFGLPPVEAMHFGKPVFLSDRTCLPEVGGDAAFYFRDFDAASMRSVVEEGLRRHAREGREALVRAHAARFDWDRTAADYLALYRRLLGRGAT